MYPKDESGKWAQETSKVAEEYVVGREKILESSAGRGFSAPSGDAVVDLFELGQAAKGKMTLALGKIYHERRTTIFQQEEFLIKMIVQSVKLGMDRYREEILEALSQEAADEDSWATKSRADIERRNAVTESRQAAIIQAHAEISHNIAVYKQRLVDAEAITLESERALVYAQLATAEKKLEIIQSIYLVLAAEQLVLAAEQRKIGSLELVLEAEQRVAVVKREMVPFYVTKAEAEMSLAEAIKAETPVQKAIVELGYDKISLETAQRAADHVVRMAEIDELLAKTAYTRAALATEVTKTRGRRELQELASAVKTYVQDHQVILQEMGIDLKLYQSRYSEEVSTQNQISNINNDITSLSQEIKYLIQGLTARGIQHANTVRASATQETTHFNSTTSDQKLYREISKG